ncbi:MAG: hypothetical protein ACC645_27670 [Pirellulales bacterium]
MAWHRLASHGPLFQYPLVGAAWLLVATLPALADPPKQNREQEPQAAASRARTRLTPSRAQGSYDFETDLIRGTIRLDGAYHGVTRLVDKRTGKQVIDTRYSALNLFKLMSVNLAMDQPRRMERTTTIDPHWLEVEWGATDSHKAVITARYEVACPDAVDVTVTVRSQGTYRGYELFMSSYFDKVLRPHVTLWSRDRRDRELVLPTVNDAFRGTVLVFPRDAHAARRCVDGRWERNERGAPTVQMCPVRHYVHCMAFMADPKNRLGVVLMSRPRDCYAISTRYHAENEADRLTPYSAFDLSLFGDDLLPGDERSVKIRLAVTPLDGDMSQPLQRYRAFIAEMAAEHQPANSTGVAP